MQALTNSLQQEAKNAGHEHPLIIGIDQENGLVARIPPPIAAQLPGQMAIGATGSSEHAFEVGKATGEVLDFLGINMNYAPECDVNSEPLNPVIGVRSPGDDPELVSRITVAMAEGMRKQRVIPTVKHFPGHGDTVVDSHHGLPILTKSREEMEKCELIPFRRAVDENIESVMTAHIALPKIGEDGLPATLSADAMNILRKDMQYDGMIVTDCIEMNSIRSTYGTVEGALMSLKAGCDSIMMSHNYEVHVQVINRICQAVESGDVSIDRIDESLRRINTLKNRFLTWDRALNSSSRIPGDLMKLNEKHSRLARQVYSDSTTVVRSAPGVLPVSPSANVLFLSPGGQVPLSGQVLIGGAVDERELKVKLFANALQAHTSLVSAISYPDSGLSNKQWQAVQAADMIILETRNAREAKAQRQLGLQLAESRPDLIVIATCNPYDFLDDTQIGTYVVTYEPTVEAFSAAASVIFGKVAAKGKLPVGNPH